MRRVVKAKMLRTKNTIALSRWLLGKVLVRARPDGSETAVLITEVEAYHGLRDRASHASRGRTPRTAVMFAPGGVWYVYLCYGVHEMLNLVTGPRDHPAAILIRGVEGASGPGRVTRLLGIDRKLNAAAAACRAGWCGRRRASALIMPARCGPGKSGGSPLIRRPCQKVFKKRIHRSCVTGEGRLGGAGAGWAA
jgi:DNA-3-methyladenine glycosylase